MKIERDYQIPPPPKLFYPPKNELIAYTMVIGGAALLGLVAMGILGLIGCWVAADILVLILLYDNYCKRRARTEEERLKREEKIQKVVIPPENIKVDPTVFKDPSVVQTMTISVLLKESEDESSGKSCLDYPNDRILGDILHELKNPLSVIKGNLDLLKREKNRNKRIKLMKEALVKMEHLTEKDLLLENLISKDFKKNFERISLNELIKQIVSDLNFLAKKNKVIVKSRLRKITVLGNRFCLGILIHNLIENAIQYNRPGRKVSIILERGENQAILKIRDKGIGIPQADLKNIFERFQRGSNVKEVKYGTGLGLSIADAVVKLHQGKLWVDSEVGKGSTFGVELPA